MHAQNIPNRTKGILGKSRENKGIQGKPYNHVAHIENVLMRVTIKPRKLRLLISNLFVQKIHREVKPHDGLLLCGRGLETLFMTLKIAG